MLYSLEEPRDGALSKVRGRAWVVLLFYAPVNVKPQGRGAGFDKISFPVRRVFDTKWLPTEDKIQ